MADYFNQLNQMFGAYNSVGVASYFVSITILIVFFFLAKITNILFSRVFARLTSRTKTNLDDKMIRILNAPIFYTVVLFGAYWAFVYIEALSKYSDSFNKIIKSVMIIIWTYAISKIAQVIISELGYKFVAKTESTLDDELMPLFYKLARIIVYFIGVVILLQTWDIDITPILASAGIAGFIVAFAAQDTISQLFGGVSIYFDKPFKVGDRIMIESGEIGDVLEIGIRSTRIKTFDETVIIIPNSKISSSKIINYNQPESKIKNKININVSYGSDVKRVKEILLDIAKNTEDVEKDPPPSVHFVNLGEYALHFVVVTWVGGPHKQFSVKTKIIEEVYDRFNKEGIKIPYPTQSIHLSNK